MAVMFGKTPVQPTATINPPDSVRDDTVAALLGRIGNSLQFTPSPDWNTRVSQQLRGALVGLAVGNAIGMVSPDRNALVWPEAAGTKATKPPVARANTVDPSEGTSGPTICGNVLLTRLQLEPGSLTTVGCGWGLGVDEDGLAVLVAAPAVVFHSVTATRMSLPFPFRAI